MKNKKNIWIIAIILVGIIVMTILDYIIKPGYFIKNIFKIIFFGGLPFLYLYFNDKKSLKNILLPGKNSLKKSVFLGLIIYLIVFGTYLFVDKFFFDFGNIVSVIGENYGVNFSNIILVMIYITFGNSFLEEFFFRGFSFIYLKNFFKRKFAYLLSAVLFGFYHIPMMTGWFGTGITSILIFSVSFVGLVLGGLIFNYLDEKNGNIYNSWMVHIFADLALLTAAFIIFGVV